MVNKKPRFKLATRFSLLISIPMLLLSAILIYIFINQNINQIKTATIERGGSLIRGLARGSEYGLMIQNTQILSDVIMSYKNENDILYIFIRDTSGIALASYGEISENINDEKHSMINNWEQKNYNTTGNNKSPNDEYKNLNWNVNDTGPLYDFVCDVLTIRKELSPEELGLSDPDRMNDQGSAKIEKIGTIQIGLSKANMLDYINKAIRTSILTTFFSVVITVIFAVSLIRVIVEPIKRLALAAGKIAQGDFDYIVQAKTKDEIGDLAESFNKMSSDLKKSRDENIRYSNELEVKAKELADSNNELNSFVYTVSHDLKAPLVSIQGFSTILMNDYKDRFNENERMYLERIQKNSERMGSLIEALLELSRIGRINGQERITNISDVISEIADELSPQLREKGTKLVIKSEMPSLRCDQTRISQVFANLIGNANKFMGDDNKNPVIEVGCDSQNGSHTFYVKDNGIGIDKEYHEKIFQIFQRLGDIETEGTGVGLAIVKKIVENFGGKIWIDSAKGKGTTMYFTIPNKQ